MWAGRGAGSSSTQTCSDTQLGLLTITKPDQNVTASSSARLCARFAEHEWKVTTRLPSRTVTSRFVLRCVPKYSDANRRVRGVSSIVTRCPAATSTGNLLPPNSRAVAASVIRPAPTMASGPTTSLSALVNPCGKPADDCPEHTFTNPVGRSAARAAAATASDVRQAIDTLRRRHIATLPRSLGPGSPGTRIGGRGRAMRAPDQFSGD